MPKGIGRVTEDIAGGPIIGALAPSVIVNGKPVAVVGAAVAGHGKPPHAAPVMVQGSSNIFAEGKRVCATGDTASCGHPLVNGSSNILIN